MSERAKGYLLGFVQGLTVACLVVAFYFQWETQKTIAKTQQILKETEQLNQRSR